MVVAQVEQVAEEAVAMMLVLLLQLRKRCLRLLCSSRHDARLPFGFERARPARESF